MAQTFGSMNDLNMLMNGAVNERWQDALQRLTRNVLDPNTDAKKTRKITLVLSVKPNDRRDGGEMTFDIKETLAPPVPVSQMVFFGMDDAGAVTATQRLNQVPGQMNMNGEETPQPVSMAMSAPQQAEEDNEERQPMVLAFK